MKKSLFIKTGLLSAASVLAVGAAIVPFSTFASEVDAPLSQSDASTIHRPMRGIGPVGVVTSILENSDGTGVLTMTISERKEGAQGMMYRSEEEFLKEHPDAPKPGDSVTFTFDSKTVFMIDGKEVSATGVAVGTEVRVLGAIPNSETPARIVTNATPPPVFNKDDRHERGGMHRGTVGTVQSFDSNNHTVTIEIPEDRDISWKVGQRVHVSSGMHDDDAEDVDDSTEASQN